MLFQEDIDDGEDDEEQEIILGRGNRARKETNYDDQLSEREWLKAIGVRWLILYSLIALEMKISFE